MFQSSPWNSIRLVNPFDSEFRSDLAGFRIAMCLETQIHPVGELFIISAVAQDIGWYLQQLNTRSSILSITHHKRIMLPLKLSYYIDNSARRRRFSKKHAHFVSRNGCGLTKIPQKSPAALKILFSLGF